MTQAEFSHAFARAAAEETLQELRLVASVSHRGEAGRAREGILRRFLSRVIPPGLGLESGFVIDGLGGVSGQVDLVLYHRDYYPVLEVGGVKHFPVECVIAVFEIKATTDSEAKLVDALEQVESVKLLDRTGGGRNYTLNPLGCAVEPDAFQMQIFGAVISERSLQPQSAMAAVEAFCRQRPRRHWPNMVVAAADYAVRYQANGLIGEDAGVAHGLVATTDDESPPLADLAIAIANLVRVAVRIDFNPSLYFPSSGRILATSDLSDDEFPGRHEGISLSDIAPTDPSDGGS